MTLVERFIDFGDWPASRKMALSTVGAGITHVFGVGLVLLVRPAAVDVSAFVGLMLGGLLLLVVIGVVAQVVYMRGHEGRWTAYLLLNLYAAYVVVFVVAMGGMSSPFMAFPLFLPLLAVVWYDPRAGVANAASYVFFLLVGGALVVTGAIPFAPAMNVRTLEDLRTTQWFLFVFLFLLSTAAIVYLMGFLMAAAARLQRQRLASAHARLELAHGLIRRYVPEQVGDSSSPTVLFAGTSLSRW
ncbi:MAG TPA: hypothetical protein VJ782_07840, partial [Aeromicrobium sp.]|nr:hypothetical protein [Aeromicrobium sp.]